MHRHSTYPIIWCKEFLVFALPAQNQAGQYFRPPERQQREEHPRQVQRNADRGNPIRGVERCLGRGMGRSDAGIESECDRGWGRNGRRDCHDCRGKQVVKGLGEALVQRLMAEGGSPGHLVGGKWGRDAPEDYVDSQTPAESREPSAQNPKGFAWWPGQGSRPPPGGSGGRVFGSDFAGGAGPFASGRLSSRRRPRGRLPDGAHQADHAVSARRPQRSGGPGGGQPHGHDHSGQDFSRPKGLRPPFSRGRANCLTPR